MKKIVFSMMTLALVAGLVGGGAFAYFNDTETSTGNTFNAGTLELKISDGHPGEWGDGCSLTWVLTNIVPAADTAGVDRVTASVTSKRLGSITPDHLEIQASVFLDENVNQVESDTTKNSDAADMAKKFQITAMLYNGQDLLTDYLQDADGDKVKTLHDMTYDPDGTPSNGLDGLPIPGTNIGTSFMMSLKWIEGADDNDFQGDTLNLTVIFTLNQDSSQ